MARFLGSASGRTIGAATGAAGFTKAKVFSSIGTTSFAVPDGVTKLKVFVVGAGSSYRTGTYAFCGASCCSGVDYPKTCYCACFTGHLTGAGGGYAEKTFLHSTDLIAGKTLTINVGSIGGLSASSVSATGLTTVTASNATEASYSWSCTSNSTARDNSNDNPISIGIQLPVCGYVNNFSGYYNRGGTASGGDINRTGGRGVLIPEFINDSYLDGLTESGLSVSGTQTNASSCWINPVVNCACGCQYHSTFGGGSGSLVSCLCYQLCTCISNLCYGTASGTQCLSSRYSFLGKSTKESGTNAPYGAESSVFGQTNNAANQFIKDVPIGVGAQSGNSLNNGNNGYSDLTLTDSCVISSTNLNTSCSLYCTTYNTGANYDFSFGGYLCTQVSVAYFPGCYSANYCRSIGCNASLCNICNSNFVYSAYSAANGLCYNIPYGLGSGTGGSGYRCINRCYNLGFIDDVASRTPPTGYSINLSTLGDENNLNIGDIAYGRGAGITTSASYGGGGNRLYPNGGSGLVVVIY